MDTIQTYLDNVFAAYPQNEKVQSLKREMLNGMIEKYQELKREGKSEHEAIGSVIANFGSIEEIISELSIEPDAVIKSDNRIFLSKEKAKNYFDTVKQCSVWIGIGVGLIFIGVYVAFFMLNLDDTMNVTQVNEDITDAVGILLFFGFIAVAVTIFIVNGMRLNKLSEYTIRGIRLDAGTQAELEEKSECFSGRFVIQIAAGVVMILMAVGSYVLLEEIGNENIAMVFIFMVVALSVFLFITAGMTKGAYDLLLSKENQHHKTFNNKGEKLIGTIAAVYWPLAVIIYLVWSFAGDAWAISWLVWPVSAILFGAIAGGIGAWYSQEN